MATWIFQANPVNYDVRGAIRALPQIPWRATRYADAIHQGDRVYLWESGPSGGIVAVAEVIERARRRQPDPAEGRFIRDPRRLSGNPPMVLLRILSVVDPSITRAELRARPGLATLSILRFFQATNFPVSLPEARELERMLSDRQGEP
jgi:EVE domain